MDSKNAFSLSQTGSIVLVTVTSRERFTAPFEEAVVRDTCSDSFCAHCAYVMIIDKMCLPAFANKNAWSRFYNACVHVARSSSIET